mgnify:CR=1 FL=1
MSQPVAFCTDTGQVVLKRTLDEYAMKPNPEQDKDPFTERIAATKSNLGENSKQAPESLVSNYDVYGLVKPPFNPKILIGFSDVNTYHSSSVKTKAVDVAGLGCRLEPLVDNPSDAEKKVLEEFINNCVPSITEIITRAAEDEEQVGFGGLELIRVGGVSTGKPLKLVHVHGHTLRIHRDKNRFMQTWDGIVRKWYKYIDEVLHYTPENDVTIEQDGQEFDVNVNTGEVILRPNNLSAFEIANDLIYDYNYSSKTSYYGTPDWIPVRTTMLGDKAAVDYNLVWFKNFGMPTYAVFITGDFDDKPLKDEDGKEIEGSSILQATLEARLKENIGNPGSGMVLLIPNDNGDIAVDVKFEKISVDIKDSSWRLYRLDNSKEVMAAHRLDPSQIGIRDTGALGGDTARQSNKNYKNRVITPRQRRWEDLINKHIIWGKKGFGFKDWKLKLEEIDTDDLQQEVNIDQILFNMAGARPIDIINKWAAKRGFNVPEKVLEHPALQAYYINGQPITLDDGNILIPPGVAKVLEEFKQDLKEAKKSYENST